MAFTSDIGRIPVIDESNFHLFADEASSVGLGRGYVERDYQRAPEGFYAPRFSSPEIPRSQWAGLIESADRNETSPDHWRLRGEVPILDQNGYGYCWAYGLVGATMVSYAQTGMKPAPQLSATSVAALAKNWRDQGGWAGEAIKQMLKTGCAELDVWPEHSMDRSLPNQEAVKRSMARHNITEYLELPRQSFAAVMSALLDPVNPRPVTLGLMWWGHLIYCTKGVVLGRDRFGVLGVNSWKRSWGEQGCVVLTESKATPHEAVAVDRTQIRMAA